MLTFKLKSKLCIKYIDYSIQWGIYDSVFDFSFTTAFLLLDSSLNYLIFLTKLFFILCAVIMKNYIQT